MVRALVLSGGASRGAFQIGVLKRWMGEQGIDYEILSGVSVGALNVAGLAMTSYGRPKEAIDWLERLWLDHVDTKTIYRRWFPFGELHALWKRSIYDSSPLIDLVSKKLDTARVAASGRKVAVGSVNLDTGEYRFARENDENFLKWVLASSSFPVFFKPIEIEGKLWSDGAVRNITPLGTAIKLGATQIDVIMCNNVTRHGGLTDGGGGMVNQASRAIDLLFEQIVFNDLRVTQLKNELAKHEPEKYRHVDVRLVAPTMKMVTNIFNFDRENIRKMIRHGYEDADKLVVV